MDLPLLQLWFGVFLKRYLPQGKLPFKTELLSVN